MKFLIILAIVNFAFAWDNFSSQSNLNGVSINRISQNGNTVVSRRSLLDNGEEKSVLTISSPSVLIDGDKFTCSGVECPKETAKCEVTSEAIASDLQKMKNIVECKDENDKVLKRGENIERNPYPTDEPPYSRVTSVTRSGDVEISDSRNYVMRVGGTNKKLSKEEQEELNKNMRRMNQDFASRMGEFENSMNQMQQNMQKTFSNNFPFGNSNPFGQNFPFGNTNPFGDNFPFGNNPFTNFRTFFYTPPVTNNNFNGYVTGSYPSYPSYSTTHQQQPNNNYGESGESEFAVEEFKPSVYHKPTYSSNNFDKYRYAY